MSSVREVLTELSGRVQENTAKVQNMTASYQFVITGDDGVTFYVDIKNGAVQVGEGSLPGAGCTVTLASQDFKDVVAGKANPTSLFFGGKLKIAGDMGLAMKLQNILR